MLERVVPYPMVYDALDSFRDHFNRDNIHTIFDAKGILLGTYASCGITVLSGIINSDPKDIVHKITVQRHYNDKKFIREAFVLFSDVDRGTDVSYGGNALARYIRDNNLGAIVEIGPRMNPNSGNQIKAWLWAPLHESLSPRDKYMPVLGKILRKDSRGIPVMYENDPRFREQE